MAAAPAAPHDPVAAFYPLGERAKYEPRLTPFGWEIDALDLSHKVFPLVLTSEMIPGLMIDRPFLPQLGHHCLYIGKYQGREVSIKVGFLLGHEIDLMLKVKGKKITPDLYLAKEFDQIHYPSGTTLKAYKDGMIDRGGSPLGVIIMDHYVILDRVMEQKEHGNAIYAALHHFLTSVVPEAMILPEDLRSYHLGMRVWHGPSVVRLVDLGRATDEPGIATREAIMKEVNDYLPFLKSRFCQRSLAEAIVDPSPASK